MQPVGQLEAADREERATVLPAALPLVPLPTQEALLRAETIELATEPPLVLLATVECALANLYAAAPEVVLAAPPVGAGPAAAASAVLAPPPPHWAACACCCFLASSFKASFS